MEDSSRNQIPLRVQAARRRTGKSVDSLEEEEEDAVRRMLPTNIVVRGVERHTWAKPPGTCTPGPGSTSTSSRRTRPTHSSTLTRRRTTRGTRLSSTVGSYRDPLTRQVAEAVQISNCEGKLLNSKVGFRQPPIVRVRREINVGV